MSYSFHASDRLRPSRVDLCDFVGACRDRLNFSLVGHLAHLPSIFVLFWLLSVCVVFRQARSRFACFEGSSSRLKRVLWLRFCMACVRGEGGAVVGTGVSCRAASALWRPQGHCGTLDARVSRWAGRRIARIPACRGQAADFTQMPWLSCRHVCVENAEARVCGVKVRNNLHRRAG